MLYFGENIWQIIRILLNIIQTLDKFGILWYNKLVVFTTNKND